MVKYVNKSLLIKEICLNLRVVFRQLDCMFVSEIRQPGKALPEQAKKVVKAPKG